MASKHSGDHDVIMVLRKNSLNGVPIKDACRNDKGIVLTTFKGQVYQCNGDPSTASKQENYDKVVFPTSELKDDPSVDIVNVCCGRQHFLALSADGRVYSWGWNGDGQLGIPKKKGKHLECPKPRLIKSISDVGVVQIACGNDHSLALTRDGRLFSWGFNRRGQLGVGRGNAKRDKRFVDKPIEVENLWGVPLQRIAAGGQHSVVLSVSGSVYVWGWNEHGQLGLQQSDNVKLPVKLESISHGDVKTISCGMHHTSFLTQNGVLMVYGMGVNRVPCESDEWRESELRPNRFSLHEFSSIQSTSRCTYAVEEFTHEIFMLDHSKAQQDDSSQNLQLVPLEKALMIDMFETRTSTIWPSPGSYVYDPEVWGSARPDELLERVPSLEELPEGDDVAKLDRLIRETDRLQGTATENHSDSVGSVSETYTEPGNVGSDSGFGVLGDDYNEGDSIFDCNGSLDDYSPMTYGDDSANVSCNDQGGEEHGILQVYEDGVSYSHANSAEKSSKTLPELVHSTPVNNHRQAGIDVAYQDPVENAISDLSGAMAAMSITNHDCPNKKAEDEPRVDDDDQENQQMPPRILRRLCPGKNTIFIIEQDEPTGEELHVSMAPRKGIDTLSAELLQSLANTEGDITEETASFRYTRAVLSSPACLNASFRPTKQNEVGVDLTAAREAFKLIDKNHSLLEKLSKSIPDEFCKSLPKPQHHKEVLQFIFILMECPIFRQHRYPWGRRLLAAMGRFMISLRDASGCEILACWWKSTPVSFRHAVKAYRKALTFLIQKRTRVEEEPQTFLTYLKVLDFLNKVNLQHNILSIKTFYIPKIDQVEFKPGERTYGRKHPLSEFRWQTYPFLIDLELKTSIFITNNLAERQNTMVGFFQRNFWAYFDWLRGLGPPPSPSMVSLTITVDRKDIFGKSVQDQLAEMLNLPMSLLRRPLKVVFVGEAGVDFGALSMVCPHGFKTYIPHIDV
nr:probable E3 ubiquitin-protein ligase HERC4 [Lytechinus pictus]